MMSLKGLDYIAVKKNKTPEEVKLVEQHERTRLARSKARIEAEFPPILIQNSSKSSE